MNKTISWFEIPAYDIGRARAFYENLLNQPMREETMGPAQLAVFAYDPAGATGGCVICGPGFKPAAEGVVVYLNAGSSLDAVLARVEAAGGSVSMPRTELPPGMGAIAHITDTEGNRVGLHATA